MGEREKLDRKRRRKFFSKFFPFIDLRWILRIYIYIYIFGSSNGLSSMMEYLLSVYRSRYFSSTFHRYARTVVIEYRPLNRYLSKGRIYISQRFRSTRSSFRKVRSILGSLSLGKHRRFERIPVFFKRFHYRGTR